jgi:hypothetical protein
MMEKEKTGGDRAASNGDAQPFEVRMDPGTGAGALHALRPFHEGDMVVPFGAREVCAYPTYLTIQTGEGRHITLDPQELQFTNHSCDPNVFFNTDSMKLEALKDIKTGEELRYFYPATEWEMDRPFDCHCGSPLCLGRISGASGMDAGVLSRYRLTSFIAEKIRERNR